MVTQREDASRGQRDEEVGLGGGRVEVAEKAMATHSSTLAWKIPWTERPGGLQSTA